MRRLRPTLALLGATVFWAACSPAPAPISHPVASHPSVAVPTPSAPPSADKSPPAPKTDPRISGLLPSVSAARMLAVGRPVPGRIVSRAELLSRIRDHIRAQAPRDAIENEALMAQLLGLIPADADYMAMLDELFHRGVAGYYEPADGTMYAADDLDDKEPLVLVHELVHALQDQRWDLRERAKYRAGEADRMLANSALAEGDAVIALVEYQLRSRGQSVVGQTERELAQLLMPLTNVSADDLPKYLVRSLVAPYQYGSQFVAHHYRKGGWEAVNAIWDKAPSSTEQILHPEKWGTADVPIPVRAPVFGSLGPGWKAVTEDTIGELGLRLAYEQWLLPSDAAKVSANWGGDRAILLRAEQKVAFAIRIRFDTGYVADQHAARAFQALRVGWRGSVRTGLSATAEFLCFERPLLGPLAFRRKGRDIAIVAGPATKGVRTFTSAGDCKGAEQWTTEVLSAP